MKRYWNIVTATALAVALPGALAALPRHPIERAALFAGCAGRMSALERHLAPDRGAGAADARAQSAAFLALLDAVTPDAVSLGMPERRPDRWQVTAQAAQGALFDMTETAEGLARTRAAAAADAHLAACRALLL